MSSNRAIKDEHLRTVLNAIPLPVFVVNQNHIIVDVNTEAEKFIAKKADNMLHQLCGVTLNCLHAIESELGCGHTEHCPGCVIRNAVEQSYSNQKVSRKFHRMLLQRDDTTQKVNLLVTASPFEIQDQTFALVLLEDISELAQLRKLLPICAGCKKIRKDDQYWEELEEYINRHFDIELSHSICPDCAKKLYPGIDIDKGQ